MAFVLSSDLENSGDAANATPVWMRGVCPRNRMIQDHHDVSACPQVCREKGGGSRVVVWPLGDEFWPIRQSDSACHQSWWLKCITFLLFFKCKATSHKSAIVVSCANVAPCHSILNMANATSSWIGLQETMVKFCHFNKGIDEEFMQLLMVDHHR